MMKQKALVAILCGCTITCAGAGVASLPLTAGADFSQVSNYKFYENDFSGNSEGDSVGNDFTVTADGMAVSTSGGGCDINFPAINYSYDWTMNCDLVLPELENTGWVGFIVVNPIAEFEATIEKRTGTDASVYIKKGGNVEITTNDLDLKPELSANTTYSYEVSKRGTTFSVLINDTKYLETQVDGWDFSATSMRVYSFAMQGVKVDNISIEKHAREQDLTLGNTIYENNFDSLTAGSTYGENITVSDDGRLFAGEGFACIDAVNASFTNDWYYRADVTFPGGKDGYYGVNVYGLKEGSNFELAVQKIPNGGYALIKEHINGENVRYHSNDHGTNPVLADNITYEVSILKIGNNLSLFVDGVLVAKYESPDTLGEATGFNNYTFNLGGVLIDNIQIKAITTSTTIDSVTVSADKTSISTLQSAQLKASVLPITAEIQTIEWKLDGQTIDGADGLTYTFSSETAGEYKLVCAVNGVDSNEITVTVTEASEDEKNALYFENFESGTKWGGFNVIDGKAVTSGAYNRSDIAFNYQRDLDISFDFTFNDAVNGDSYIGVVLAGMTESLLPASEVEFNVHRAGLTASEGNVDNCVIKYNGVERFFSNDETKGGRLETIEYETGRTYNYRLVRYDDQFELYIDGTLAIKYFIKDANSAPLAPSGIFLYTFNGDSASISIDNLVIKTAQEITDRVEPPVVTVESAYITSSSVSMKKGENATLTVQSSPFDATVTSYAWYVNDTLIAGATEKSYVFKATAEGEYVFKCVVNGTVTSETKKITVKADAPQTEPPAEETPETGDNTGLIVGLSVGGGVLVLAVAGIVIWRVIVKKRGNKSE